MTRSLGDKKLKKESSWRQGWKPVEDASVPQHKLGWLHRYQESLSDDHVCPHRHFLWKQNPPLRPQKWTCDRAQPCLLDPASQHSSSRARMGKDEVSR